MWNENDQGQNWSFKISGLRLWMSIRRIKLFVLVGRQGTSKLRIGCVAKLVQTNPQFILCLVWCYWHQSIWLLAPVDDSVDHRFQTRGLWVAFIQPLANILISSHLTQIFFWCASVFLETWQIFKLDAIKGIEIWNHFEFITFWNASQIRSLDDLTLGSTLFSSASFFMAAPQAASHRLVLGPTSWSQNSISDDQLKKKTDAKRWTTCEKQSSSQVGLVMESRPGRLKQKLVVITCPLLYHSVLMIFLKLMATCSNHTMCPYCILCKTDQISSCPRPQKKIDIC